MPRTISITKDYILEKSVLYILENGLESLNVRSLSKYIGCSTQPIFKNYKNMDEFKVDLKSALHDHYNDFINGYINREDYLLTISYAYALYALKYPNGFRALFVSDLAGSRTVNEVINSSWNRETIENASIKYNLSIDNAEVLYRDVRFYTHGIATQIAVNSIVLSESEIYELIKNNISKNLKG